jgi:hypothetical protein
VGISFGDRRHVGKPKVRWKDDVCWNFVHVLKIRNWKAAAREKFGIRRPRRPWPENGPKCCRRKN